jgi:hypothetical protein
VAPRRRLDGRRSARRCLLHALDIEHARRRRRDLRRRERAETYERGDAEEVEHPIRSIAIGKRNSPFAGDNGGAETWAILSTLNQTARLNGVDPETWLADVLERMVSGVTTSNRLAELLVWNWKAARDQAEAAA